MDQRIVFRQPGPLLCRIRGGLEFVCGTCFRNLPPPPQKKRRWALTIIHFEKETHVLNQEYWDDVIPWLHCSGNEAMEKVHPDFTNQNLGNVMFWHFILPCFFAPKAVIIPEWLTTLGGNSFSYAGSLVIHVIQIGRGPGRGREFVNFLWHILET